MTTFAPHRDTLESFVDCIHGGADKDTLTRLLAEDVVLYGPFGDEPVTGRDAVNGIFFVLLDADAKIAEVRIFYRTLPSGVALQRNLADVIGMQAWELRTDGE